MLFSYICKIYISPLNLKKRINTIFEKKNPSPKIVDNIHLILFLQILARSFSRQKVSIGKSLCKYIRSKKPSCPFLVKKNLSCYFMNWCGLIEKVQFDNIKSYILIQIVNFSKVVFYTFILN